MAVAVPQVVAGRIANLERMAWAWQDIVVAGVAPQVVTGRIANLERMAQAIVVECPVAVDRRSVEDRSLESAEVSW
jgi:hypothetical protein